MRTVALIHAHKDPAQIDRLVAAVSDERFVAYVHVDAKSAIDVRALDPRARLVADRERVGWGDYSQVQAILNALAQVERDEDYDYLMLMSGQDYPVWSRARLARHLDGAGGREFMDCVPLDAEGWAQGAQRVVYPHYRGANPLVRAGYRAARGVMRALAVERRLPGGLRPYGGSAWFAVTRPCVRHILGFVAAHPEYVEFMKTVSIPDESFFQTIVGNSPFRASLGEGNLHYIDWSEGLPNPRCLTEADFDRIVASGKAFCRKIDVRTGSGLADRLDAHRHAS